MIETGVVFVVGSNERNRFIIDRVYFDKQEAIDYCDSRVNSRFVWSVVEMQDGDMWFNSRFVHTTEGKVKRK